LNEARALSAARARHRLARDLVDSADVLAIHYGPWHSIGLCTRSDSRLTVTARERRRYRVAVVLAEIDHRQPPERAHVERFMERALVHGPVAEEAEADLLRFADFGTQSHT